MFFYIFINRFKKQRIVVSLIILSSMLTSLIISFSYGVYHNYRAKINQGDTEGKTVTISALYSVADKYKDRKYADVYPMEDKDLNISEYTSITQKDLIDTVMSFSEETMNAIDNVECEATLEDSVYQLNCYHFIFKPSSKGIIPVSIDSDQFTDEQYINGEKVARIGADLYTESASANILGTYLWENEGARQVSEDETEIVISGEKYKIIGKAKNDPLGINIYIPFTSLPPDTPIRGGDTVIISFSKNVTYRNLMDIKRAVEKIMPDKAQVMNVELKESTEKSYYRTIIAITVLVSLLSCINLAVLYTFVIENDKRRISILRLCGCRASKAIRFSLIEIAILTIPVFVLSQFLYHKLLIPKLLYYFPFIAECYSLKIYTVILLIYILMSFLVMKFSLHLNIRKKNKVWEGLS